MTWRLKFNQGRGETKTSKNFINGTVRNQSLHLKSCIDAFVVHKFSKIDGRERQIRQRKNMGWVGKYPKCLRIDGEFSYTLWSLCKKSLFYSDAREDKDVNDAGRNIELFSQGSMKFHKQGINE